MTNYARVNRNPNMMFAVPPGGSGGGGNIHDKQGYINATTSNSINDFLATMIGTPGQRAGSPAAQSIATLQKYMNLGDPEGVARINASQQAQTEQLMNMYGSGGGMGSAGLGALQALQDKGTGSSIDTRRKGEMAAASAMPQQLGSLAGITQFLANMNIPMGASEAGSDKMMAMMGLNTQSQQRRPGRAQQYPIQGWQTQYQRPTT